MPKLLRCAADLVVAVFLAAALLVVYRWDTRTEETRPRPATDADLKVTTDEQTQVEELPPEPLKLAITPARFDDMGKLLDTLGAGFKYDIVEDAKLEDPAVCQRYDVIFLTCAETNSPQSREKLKTALRQFVGQGGTLYASDLRFDLLAAAFPGFVDATAVAQGTQQDLRAEVLEPGLRAILGNELPLHFDLEGWRPAAFGGRNVTVYVKGKFQTTAGVSLESPLLVKFSAGNGTVLFTSFHNEKQNNDAEVQMLKYLVFTMVTAKVESKVTKTMVSGGFSPQQQNLLSATVDHPSVTSRYEHKQAGDLQFALGFERQGAKLRLEVKSPDGKSFVQEGDTTFTISVPAAGSGTWQYTVVAEKLPYPNRRRLDPGLLCRQGRDRLSARHVRDGHRNKRRSSLPGQVSGQSRHGHLYGVPQRSSEQQTGGKAPLPRLHRRHRQGGIADRQDHGVGRLLAGQTQLNQPQCGQSDGHAGLSQRQARPAAIRVELRQSRRPPAFHPGGPNRPEIRKGSRIHARGRSPRRPCRPVAVHRGRAESALREFPLQRQRGRGNGDEETVSAAQRSSSVWTTALAGETWSVWATD